MWRQQERQFDLLLRGSRATTNLHRTEYTWNIQTYAKQLENCRQLSVALIEFNCPNSLFIYETPAIEIGVDLIETDPETVKERVESKALTPPPDPALISAEDRAYLSEEDDDDDDELEGATDTIEDRVYEFNSIEHLISLINADLAKTKMDTMVNFYYNAGESRAGLHRKKKNISVYMSPWLKQLFQFGDHDVDEQGFTVGKRLYFKGTPNFLSSQMLIESNIVQPTAGDNRNILTSFMINTSEQTVSHTVYRPENPIYVRLGDHIEKPTHLTLGFGLVDGTPVKFNLETNPEELSQYGVLPSAGSKDFWIRLRFKRQFLGYF